MYIYIYIHVFVNIHIFLKAPSAAITPFYEHRTNTFTNTFTKIWGDAAALAAIPFVKVPAKVFENVFVKLPAKVLAEAFVKLSATVLVRMLGAYICVGI